MIPIVNDGLEEQFELVEQPSRTYKVDSSKGRIIGIIDNKEALEQCIYKLLGTQRYEHLIYSWDYGVELDDLFGKPIPYVFPELKRRITEALTQDERIQSVGAFSFERHGSKVHVTFIVHSTKGDIPAETEVDIRG